MSSSSEKTLLQTAIDACIHCGMCLSSCPTYVVTGDEAQSPRGRIHQMQAVEQGELTLQDIQPNMETCLGCMACETACPSQVPYHHVLEAARFSGDSAGLNRFHGLAVVMQWILNRDWLLALAAFGMRLAQTLGIRTLMQRSFWPEWILNKTRLWPTLPTTGLHPHLKPLPNESTELSLHLGCVMKHLMPDVHNACYDVLHRMGYTISAAAIDCCGALASHHGLKDQTCDHLSRNAEAFSTTRPIPILSNAGGCGAMLKEYGDLGKHFDLPENTQNTLTTLVDQVDDIHAFVHANQSRLPELRLPTKTIVTYQASCHLNHAQGITEAPLALLKRIENVDLIPMRDATSCCGSAGIYNLEFPETADAIGREKVDRILETGASIVVVGNPGCLLQLRASLLQYAPDHDIQVLHPMQVLAHAMR